MAIFENDAVEMRKKLAALKKAVNDKRQQSGLSAITNDHLLLEMIETAFNSASSSSGAGLYISNVFVKLKRG